MTSDTKTSLRKSILQKRGQMNAELRRREVDAINQQLRLLLSSTPWDKIFAYAGYRGEYDPRVLFHQTPGVDWYFPRVDTSTQEPTIAFHLVRDLNELKTESFGIAER